MSFIHRQMWLHCFMLVFSLGLTGCGSKNAGTATAVAPPANTTPAPAMPMPHAGAHNPPGTASPHAMPHMQAGANPSNAAAPGTSADHAAMMAKMTNPAQNANKTAAPGTSADHAAMMAKMTNPAQNATNPSTAAPGTSADHAAMMAKMTNPAQNAANPNTAAPGTSADHAAMMKKMQGNGAQGGNGGAVDASKMQHGAMAANAQGGAGLGGGRGRGRQGQGQGGQTPTFKHGSADAAIYNFCVAMAEGDTNAASEYISAKAKGQLAEMKEGTLADDKIEEITGMIAPVSELKPNGEQSSSNKRSLVNGKGQTMSFTLKKEKDDDKEDIYRITEFSFPKSKRKS